MVEIWAYDVVGNGDFCEVSIEVQENFDNCNIGFVIIVGIIFMEFGIFVVCILVGLFGSVSVIIEVYVNGVYVFINLLEGQFYIVVFYNNINLFNGIFLFDKELIENYIFGLFMFILFYQLIVVDIDNNGEIFNKDVI